MFLKPVTLRKSFVFSYSGSQIEPLLIVKILLFHAKKNSIVFSKSSLWRGFNQNQSHWGSQWWCSYMVKYSRSMLSKRITEHTWLQNRAAVTVRTVLWEWEREGLHQHITCTSTLDNCPCFNIFVFTLKGMIWPKIKIILFIYPQVVPNTYCFLLWKTNKEILKHALLGTETLI